ncbi:hypothetical protein ACFOD9_02750 [Novosphingobium bradum]|uniref:DUF2892 domain-containing protein n=1 Tax=Novosphingobium bradum TaxID=1737444 RepID=A0ABV7IKP7_9SPHN
MTSSPPDNQTAKDPAKARFIAISLVRLSGALLVLFGLMITERRVDLPWALGVVLTVAGFFDVFVMPKLLARRWRTPRP